MSKTATPATPAPAPAADQDQPAIVPQEVPNPGAGGCYVRDPITGALSPDPTTTTDQE